MQIIYLAASQPILQLLLSMKTNRFFVSALVFLVPLCDPLLAADNDSVTMQDFGSADGLPVSLYTLANAHGMSASITNYGGTVVNLLVPDREGKSDDVVLGFDSLDGYLAEKGGPY